MCGFQFLTELENQKYLFKAKMSVIYKHSIYHPLSTATLSLIYTDLLQPEEPTLNHHFAYLIYLQQAVQWNTITLFLLCSLPKSCLKPDFLFFFLNASHVKDWCWTHTGEIFSMESLHSYRNLHFFQFTHWQWCSYISVPCFPQSLLMLYYRKSDKLKHSCIKCYSTSAEANPAGTARKTKYWDVKYSKKNINLPCPRSDFNQDRGQGIQSGKTEANASQGQKTPQVTQYD